MSEAETCATSRGCSRTTSAGSRCWPTLRPLAQLPARPQPAVAPSARRARRRRGPHRALLDRLGHQARARGRDRARRRPRRARHGRRRARRVRARAASPCVDAFQAAALKSLAWLEHVEPHLGLDPVPFAYRHMMRSQRIGYARLEQMDPHFAARYDRWRAEHAADGTDPRATSSTCSTSRASRTWRRSWATARRTSRRCGSTTTAGTSWSTRRPGGRRT